VPGSLPGSTLMVVGAAEGDGHTGALVMPLLDVTERAVEGEVDRTDAATLRFVIAAPEGPIEKLVDETPDDPRNGVPVETGSPTKNT
jgi:hypothetical protein